MGWPQPRMERQAAGWTALFSPDYPRERDDREAAMGCPALSLPFTVKTSWHRRSTEALASCRKVHNAKLAPRMTDCMIGAVQSEPL